MDANLQEQSAVDRLALIPDEAYSVALVSKRVACVMGDVRESWWDERVARGEAPAPVIRAPRFSRWRLVDVIEFWRRVAEQGDPQGAAKMAAIAKRASAARSAQRIAAAKAAASGTCQT